MLQRVADSFRYIGRQISTAAHALVRAVRGSPERIQTGAPPNPQADNQGTGVDSPIVSQMSSASSTAGAGAASNSYSLSDLSLTDNDKTTLALPHLELETVIKPRTVQGDSSGLFRAVVKDSSEAQLNGFGRLSFDYHPEDKFIDIWEDTRKRGLSIGFAELFAPMYQQALKEGSVDRIEKVRIREGSIVDMAFLRSLEQIRLDTNIPYQDKKTAIEKAFFKGKGGDYVMALARVGYAPVKGSLEINLGDPLNMKTSFIFNVEDRYDSTRL